MLIEISFKTSGCCCSRGPQIIDFLASYTYRSEKVLLFSAPNYNLAEAFFDYLLSQLSEEEIWKQICGLTTAV